MCESVSGQDVRLLNVYVRENMCESVCGQDVRQCEFP